MAGERERGQAEYDIQLRCKPSGPLGAVFPGARACTTPTLTALVGEVREPAQLDWMLERVQSVGLVLDAIHRLDATSAAGTSMARYEIRVHGEIGTPLLRYLRWRHHVVPERTLVQVTASYEVLLSCLRACTAAGASIDHVHVRRLLPVQHL